MSRHPRLLLALISSVSLIAATGCGASGSNPPLYAEVQFLLTAAGSVTFTVDALEAGQGTPSTSSPSATCPSACVSHPSVIGQSFTASSDISFFLENAAPPYRAVFHVTGGALSAARVHVSSLVNGDKTANPLANQSVIVLRCDVTAPITVPPAAPTPGFVCSATAETPSGTPTPVSTAPAADPEIRFDVCAPQSGQTCTTLDNTGIAGIPFLGVLGDYFLSHQISGQTPSIFFLEGALNSVAARFINSSSQANIQKQFLQGELFVNGGQPVQTKTATDVTLGLDL